MKMNVITSFALAGATAVALMTGSATAQTVLTLNNWLPPSHPQVTMLMKPLAEDIERVTEGRVKVQILPAPLAPPPASFDLARNGVADITYSVNGYTPGRFKTAVLGEMPFLGDSAEAVSVGYWRTYEKMLKDANEYEGVKVMALYTHGPGVIFMKDVDLSTPEAIAGKKIRVGSTMAHDLTTSLGAVPVEGPSSKAYELLSQGIADGILFPFESVSFFNLIPLLNQGLEFPGGLYNSSFFIVMNQAKFDSLDPKDREAIETVIGEPLVRRAGKMWDTVDAAGRSAMEGKITLHKATAEEVEALKVKFQPVIDKRIAEVSTSGVDGAAAYEMLKAEIAKAAAE
jgi:TRAP-type C4-dicarboxylate transport system substrate-binding protein